MARNQKTEEKAGAEENKSSMSDTIKKVAKEVIGEGSEIIASGIVAGGLMSLFKKIFSSSAPKIQEHIEKKVEKELSDTTTRTDDGRFHLTLAALNVSREYKDLFGKLHHEMRNPNTSGKTPEELVELRKRSKQAKGLVFLINQVYIDNGPDEGKSLAAVNKIWHGIFCELDKLPTKKAKLKILEQRIIQCGENSKEHDTIPDILRTLHEWDAKLKPAEEYKGLGNNVTSKFKKIYGR